MESAHDALRHRRLTRLFTKARALGVVEREAWVVEACGGDGALEEELRALLAADAAGGVLEEVAAGEAHRERLERQLDRLVTEPDGDAGQVPERIGPFCPKEVIGRGGMAVVYLAQQDKPRRDVALKVLRGDVSAEAAARIEREADLLARLEHPCIARIYSAGRAQTPWGEQGYIAMELVNGRPLLRFAREESLGLRARVELMVRIAQALESAHGRGIVHRDLKASNILVQRDGTPKLLDFGVARLRSIDLGDTAHTRTGQIVGTLATMAPEQAAGHSDVDERADVYALGVLLYELCADRLPIDTRGLPLHEALRRIQEDDPVPLGALRPNLRGDIETIVLKALEKEPRRRYRDAGEFALDLARYLADEPILARTQRWRDHMRRFARRHRALVVGVGVAFLGLIATLVVSLFLLGRAKAENRRAIRGREAALRLTDLRRLGQLQRTAAVLWPAQEARMEEFEAWIAEATLMVGKLDWHRSLLEVFRERFGSPVGRKRLAMEDSVNAKINGELWMYEAQEELVRRLAHFADRGGLFERLKERRDFAASLKRRTVDDLARDWERAAEWVRDPAGPYAMDSGNPALAPQPGLIPLGRDARTGLLALVLDIFGLAPTAWDPEHSSLSDWGACVVLLLPSGEEESKPVYLAAWPVGSSVWRDFEGSPGAHQQPEDKGGMDAIDRTQGAPGPQTLVSFDEAEEFARHLGGRLPTARELERALSLGVQTAGPGLAEWVVRDGEPWVAGPDEALGSAAQARMRSPKVTFRIVLDPGP